MDLNFPELDGLDGLDRLDRLDPHTQQITSALRRQHQAVPSTGVFRQQCHQLNQYPQSQAHANDQRMPMASSSFTTPSFAHTSTLHRPPTDTGPAFQSSFPYSYGQTSQRESTYLPFPNALPDSYSTPNNALNIPYQSDQLGSAYIPEPSTPHDPNTSRPQHLPSVAAWQGYSHMGSSPPVDANTIAPGTTTAILPRGTYGLRFDSYETAFATIDPMFRDSVTIEDDDVLEVVQNKWKHVKSLVDAMRHDSFITAVDYKKTELGRAQTIDTQRFDRWQNRAREVVDAHFTMPKADEKIECVAWQIFEEIVEVHRTGFRVTKQTSDSETKCSKHIEDAVGVIKDFALVRQKLLERGNIYDLATSPKAFASNIAQFHRNNSKRPTGTGQGRGGAKSDGAIGKTYMSRAEFRQWVVAAKAKKATNGDGASNVNDRQQLLSANVNMSSASVSIPVVVEEASAFTANNLDVQRPPAQPNLGTSAALWEPPQTRGHETASPPRFGIDDVFDFERDLSPGVTGGLVPHEGVNYGAGAGAIFDGFTFENPTGGILFPNQQATHGAQHQSRCGVEPDRPSQLTAAYSTRPIVAAAGSTGIPQHYGASPGASANKRRRTDSVAVPEYAWYGTQ